MSKSWPMSVFTFICDLLFALRYKAPSEKKKGLLSKERICYEKEQKSSKFIFFF